MDDMADMSRVIVEVINNYCSGLNQGHTVFLGSLKTTLKQKYTPHTHGYGREVYTEDTVYQVRYRVDMYYILSLHPNITLYIHHRRLKYNKTV